MDDRSYYHLLIGIGLAALVACSLFNPPIETKEPVTLPETYSLYNDAAVSPTLWWESVGSPELNRLVEEALSDNITLKEAWFRLVQARSLAVQAGADRFPDLSGSGFAETTRRRSQVDSNGASGQENYSLGLISNYELDLWGRVRSQWEAALLSAKATESDLQAASVTLAAEVADRWVRVISQRLQKNLLEKQLENNRTFLELIELRFRKAMVSALDVYQQKQVVEGVRAQIPLVEAETRLLLNELAVLLGRPPRTDLELTQDKMPMMGPLPAIGLPADLLSNRPDVRAAGMRLKASEWQVSAAKANRLPALQLTAGAQYGRSDLDVLFDTWLLSLAANLTAPILDGGRRAAEVQRAQALADENLWAYGRVVLNAVKEVEDSLESENRQRQHIEGLEAVMAAARRALEEAIQRYRRGLSDYLPVLTQLLAVQDLERDLIRQQEILIRYRIGLYRALGGGWLDISETSAIPQMDGRKG